MVLNFHSNKSTIFEWFFAFSRNVKENSEKVLFVVRPVELVVPGNFPSDLRTEKYI